MKHATIALAALLCGCHSATASTLSIYEACLLKRLQGAADADTAAQIKQACLAHQVAQLQPTSPSDTPDPDEPPREFGALSSRMIKEKSRQNDPFVIIPHRKNYILPAYSSNNINHRAYNDVDNWSDNLSDLEAKFQLSLKVPLNPKPLLTLGDGLYFAFTIEAWWQLYSNNMSKPFRETNYRPEVFYFMPFKWRPFNGNLGFFVGAEHQSNGRSQQLSRSWNRLYSGFLYEQGDFVLSLKPWWRLPEKADKYPGDPEGDDNPDIESYLGHFELNAAYTWSDYELNVMTRRNFSTDKGAIELSWTFPLWGRLRGYTSVFSGYGESLIDYDHQQTRYGIGIALTDLLD